MKESNLAVHLRSGFHTLLDSCPNHGRSVLLELFVQRCRLECEAVLRERERCAYAPMVLHYGDPSLTSKIVSDMSQWTCGPLMVQDLRFKWYVTLWHRIKAWWRGQV